MPDGTLPTHDEIAKLPQWAQVSFATQCARRAQPLFLLAWPNTPIKHLIAVERAINVAGNTAAAARADDDAKVAHADASTAFHATVKAGSEADDVATADSIGRAAFVARAARAAARAAAYAHLATSAARDAEDAAAKAGVNAKDIRSDFDSLVARSKSEQWTDTTPVSPAVVSPLPDTAPVPKRTASDELPMGETESELVLRTYLRDGTDPQVARQKLRTLYNTLNDYSIAKFGKGLTVKDFQQYLLTGVPAEVLG